MNRESNHPLDARHDIPIKKSFEKEEEIKEFRFRRHSCTTTSSFIETAVTEYH